MADVHSVEKRSYNMSQIKSKNTKPELRVRSYLHKCSFRFRIHKKELPGTPDIVLPKFKTAIFIHGCFWHGHENCRYFRLPKSKTEWWENKISGNSVRDVKNIKALEDLGWRVIILWECDLNPKVMERNLEKLILQLKNKL